MTLKGLSCKTHPVAVMMVSVIDVPQPTAAPEKLEYLERYEREHGIAPPPAPPAQARPVPTPAVAGKAQPAPVPTPGSGGAPAVPGAPVSAGPHYSTHTPQGFIPRGQQ